MRVLVVNKFWYGRGGLERVMFDEVQGLQDVGHEVVHFSTQHPQNDASPWEDYFAPYLEIGGDSALGTSDKARAVARLFSNGVAAQAFERLVTDTNPDIVHVHGIHRQISPSIFAVARRRNIPVVHTLHDYHLVCPADVLLRGGVEPCLPRQCGTYWYGPAVRNRCLRGGLGTTLLSSAELMFQRIVRAYERGVTRFVSPSAFLKARMLEGGWTRVPIDVLRQGVRLTDVGARGSYFLYAGRLSPEKGVEVLLQAARLAGVEVCIAGDGPSGASLRESYPEVRFVGHVSGAEVAALLRQARAAVVPSVCLENSPMGVSEALAAGVPVIASAVGGIPEMVDDGVEGLLLPQGDVEALAAALRRLAEDTAEAERMGQAARACAEREFGMKDHIAGLVSVYERALDATKEEHV